MVLTTTQESTTLHALPADYLKRVDLRRMYPDKKGNPVMVHCPAHHDSGKPNLAVYPRNVYCFHPGCSYHDGVFGYVKRVTGFTSREMVLRYVQSLLSDEVLPMTPQDTHAAPPPPLDRELVEGYARNLHKPQLRFLERRYGLNEAAVQGAHIGHTGSFPYAYTIPVYDLGGELVNIRYRADPEQMAKTELKYWGMKGRNQTTLYVPPRILGMSGETYPQKFLNAQGGVVIRKPWVFLAEGEFDALALHLMGYVAASVTNGAKAFQSHPDELVDAFRGCGVMVCYDQDSAGRVGRIPVLRALMQAGIECRSVEWDPVHGKDASAVLARYRDTAWIDNNARFLRTRLASPSEALRAAPKAALTGNLT